MAKLKVRKRARRPKRTANNPQDVADVVSQIRALLLNAYAWEANFSQPPVEGFDPALPYNVGLVEGPEMFVRLHVWNKPKR